MEEQSYSLYLHAVKVASSPESKRLLQGLTEEELKHKGKLEKAKSSGEISGLGAQQRAVNLGILDHVQDAPLWKRGISGNSDISWKMGKKRLTNTIRRWLQDST